MPAVVTDLAGPDAAERWDGLALEQQRQVIRILMSVTVHRTARRGVRELDASSIDIRFR